MVGGGSRESIIWFLFRISLTQLVTIGSHIDVLIVSRHFRYIHTASSSASVSLLFTTGLWP
ncbi:hypothetical protein L873DRAFT_1881127 [Choiromyces venosus 120613-1]|uniref:Uncharacterized protein n=1 Tax=Choiromyces venosus 120613-1 TaxID=1336337 RepID=A0A3N4JY95_9PEZI|nr:hypothetical protein L873DRAFT_1881127 [Choiromyces venosus 120613-1]